MCSEILMSYAVSTVFNTHAECNFTFPSKRHKFPRSAWRGGWRGKRGEGRDCDHPRCAPLQGNGAVPDKEMTPPGLEGRSFSS